MGELGRLIQAHKDAERYDVTNAAIARQVGVTRGAVGYWIKGTARPSAESTRRLAKLLGIPHAVVLNAVLLDAGYLQPKDVPSHDATAANARAGASPAEVIEATAEPLTSPKLKPAAGPRRPPAPRRQG